MSFYHILPSDSAKDRFPNNKAAQFSIPIDGAQHLDGQWEVAVAQLSYSNCLYTFDNETISIGEPRTKAYQCDTGCRIHLPPWTNKDRQTAHNFVINFLNESLNHIMKLTPTTGLNYKAAVEKDWVVCFSQKLAYEMGNVINAKTSYDSADSNHHTMTGEWEYAKNQFYVDVLPLNDKTLVKTIMLKTKNVDMTVDRLANRFNYLLQWKGKKVAKLVVAKSGHIIIEKLIDDDLVLVVSKDFHDFLNHFSAAVHGKYNMRYFRYDHSNQFSKEWSVSLYKKNTEGVGGHSFKRKVLKNHIMKSTREVVNYLNDTVNDSRILFRYKNDFLSLGVEGKDIVVRLDDTLRDILGFDQNKFESGKVVRAKDKISLSRRINYFAIYSNITANVRVGNVEAPLLTMFPFNPKDCSILSERRFKKFHYVDLKTNYIAQIDISMYDDAGALIPFHKDAITSVTLHFRRKS